MTTLSCKGYIARIEADPEADILHGEVINICDLLTFHGRSLNELAGAFADAVEHYEGWCHDHVQAFECLYSGALTLRITPDLHRRAVLAAAGSGRSLNRFIEDALEDAVRSQGAGKDREIAPPSASIRGPVAVFDDDSGEAERDCAGQERQCAR